MSGREDAVGNVKVLRQRRERQKRLGGAKWRLWEMKLLQEGWRITALFFSYDMGWFFEVGVACVVFVRGFWHKRPTNNKPGNNLELGMSS